MSSLRPESGPRRRPPVHDAGPTPLPIAFQILFPYLTEFPNLTDALEP